MNKGNSWILINCCFHGNQWTSNLALYLKMLVLVTAIYVPNFMLVSKSAQFAWNLELCRRTIHNLNPYYSKGWCEHLWGCRVFCQVAFSDNFDLRTLLPYLHFIQVPIHLSFINIIYHFDMLSLAVWQDTCHTHLNPVYDLASHESPITECLERPTVILEGHGFDSRWGLRKIFFRVFRLENASPLFRQ